MVLVILGNRTRNVDGIAPDKQPKANRTRIAGLHGNVRVDSEFGRVPIALLRRGDRLRCHEGSLARIASIDVCRFDQAMMEARPDLRPVRINEGSLGAGLPRQTVLLAPDQEIGDGAPRRSGAFKAARALLTLDAVDRVGPIETCFYTLRLAVPGAFLAEGLLIRA